VENYFRFIAEEMREYMAWLGFRTVDEMIGRVDRLKVKKEVLEHPKYGDIDLSRLLAKPDVPKNYSLKNETRQEHGLEDTLDHRTLIPLCRNAIYDSASVTASIKINNTDRSVGTMTAGVAAKVHGIRGLAGGNVRISFTGSAGQSFGAFLPGGFSFTLAGDANDYVGKGLSGGEIIVKRNPRFTQRSTDNIIVGNVTLYGAISGEAYFEGVAGERFCVRNSGATAVVEGTGDHACEYMTGGYAVVLGNTGVNFGAGMSGGIAYVYDEEGEFLNKLNMEMVEVGSVEVKTEVEWLRKTIEKHLLNTGSEKAADILENFDVELYRFKRVIPKDFKRMKEAIEEAEKTGMSPDEARMKAFYGNISQMSRASGN